MRLFIASILLASTGLLAAQIHTVDNSAGTTADFATIAAAIAAASDGDTLYIHPSLTSYGSFNLTKSLYLFGPGHHPAVTSWVNATVGSISMRTGSSGSYIAGLEIWNIDVATWNVSNDITLENNLFRSTEAIDGAASDNAQSFNWVIRGNVFENEGTGCGGCDLIDQGTGSRQLGPTQNWIISHNLIHSVRGFSEGSNQIFDNLNVTSVIQNNTIVVKFGSQLYEETGSENALFQNNIFYLTTSLSSVDSTCVNCAYNNNLTYSTKTALPTLPGSNLNNQEPLFKEVADLSGWDISQSYQLLAASPGVGAGTDGTDIGHYGGGYTFSKYGPPPLPTVSELIILNPSVENGQSLKVVLRAE